MYRSNRYSHEMYSPLSSAQARPNLGDAELHEPYTGADISSTKYNFSEAVVIDPVLAGRRRRAGVFGDVNEQNEAFYAPVEAFEGRHRYDPKFEWEPRDERVVVRKIDWRICTWACLMFFALQLDKTNIVQALSDNMLDDLGIVSNDYNYGQTIYYICFIIAELPSQLVSKRLGPDTWIPIQMVTWSLVAACQAFMSNRTGFFVCRALLGIIEGGFIPDCILYLSYFYTSSELPRRLAFFWVASQVTNIIGAFLAFGFLRLRGVNGRPGWSWLFALEGLITGLIGIASWFYLPPSPYQTASKVRGAGWFTEREEKVMANRILRDDPGKGDMYNRQGLSWTAFKASISDYHMWPIYLIGLSWNIPATPMQGYISLNMKEVGFGTFETNLLIIPASLLFIVGFWTFLSEHVNERFLLSTLSQIWVIPCFAALIGLPDSRSNWTNYALSVLVYGMPYVHVMFTSLASRNAGSVRTRTVASAIYNMTVQAAGIIGINVYRTGDSPLYRHGNTALIVIAVYNIVVMVGAKLYYIRINKKRSAIWDSMSEEERENYLSTTMDQGNKRLDFRFAH